MKENPIVIIEDNTEDCEFLTEALNIVGVQNPLRCFDNAIAALEYLRSTEEIPFLIISDIKMPLMDGLQLKRSIDADKKLSDKKIPFIFLSTLPPSFYTKEIENLSVQGHFKKPAKFDELIHIVRSIIDSWNRVQAMAS
ncbi:MAG: response regulator [Ferruginibacter sp.]